MSFEAAFYLLGCAFFCASCIVFGCAHDALSKAKAAREDAAENLEIAGHLYTIAECLEASDRAPASQPDRIAS